MKADRPETEQAARGDALAPPEAGQATDRAARRSAERERDAAQASRDRFSFLAEVSRCLADSLDYETTLTTVAGMSLPYLDAWCIVDVLTLEGEVRRLAVLHPDAAKQVTARELHLRYPPRTGDLIGAPRVIRTGRPEMVFDVPDAALVAAAHDEHHLALLRALGIRSYVIVPMVARGRVLGAITFVTAETQRRFGDIDVVMAEDLARRAAMAVDNAHLHTLALEARDSAEAALKEALAAEEQLRQARDVAEEALKARDAFVATMTHEVQTPLNAIIGYLQLLEMDISGALGDTQRSYVTRAQESSRHLLRLVGDVLDFAKTEAAGMVMARDEVRAADTARSALSLVRPQAAGKLLTLVDLTADADDLRYLGDEYRVRQILLNLLSNAVKFTPPGGRVTLECRAEGGADGGAWLLFRDADRIFEPFVQGSAGLTRPHGGTGLGLPISRRLARMMGGDVTVEGHGAEGGDGAVFTLRLPAAAASAPGARGEDAGAPAEPSPAPPGPSAPGAGTEAQAAARRGLGAAAEALLRQVTVTVDEFVRRARAEPALAIGPEMTDVDVSDHLGTLVIDVANSLAVLGGAAGEPTELLADGSRIQRLIGELHGAQRQRLGWTEAQIEREMELVRAVCMEAIDRSAAVDPRAAEAGRTALSLLLQERLRACLSGFRASAAASA